MLPADFDWRSYEALIRNHDHAFWAAEFMVRDPQWNARDTHASAAIIYRLDGGPPHTAWRNGVLCSGMKGHSTHRDLRESLNALREECPTEKTAVKSSNGGNFSSTEKAEAFRRAYGALFGGTLELAINLRMPKKELLAEVERLLDEHQKRFVKQEFIRIDDATTLQWARGLAIVDLRTAGTTPPDIQRQLVPIWVGDSPVDGAPNDSWKKLYRRAYNSVLPFISGGWRTLCGDPMVFSYAHKTLPK